MVLLSRNPWETCDKESLVSVGTHNLWVSTSGPPRKPGQPVVIYLTGGGAPAAFHIRLQGLLSRVTRVYFYDRAGYDLSERAPNTETITAHDSAIELHKLLRDGMQVMPPYILVAHSYGAIIARTFLALYPGKSIVAGMVLAEAATELMYELIGGFMDILGPIAEGVDLIKLTHLREESKLSDEEWDRGLLGVERSQEAAAAEDNHASGRALVKFQQFRHGALGDRPLSVMRCNMANDFRIMYNAGVKAGNGTEEQRRAARDLIERTALFDDELRASQLRLSKVNRYVHYEEMGHDFVVIRPDLLVAEVEWVIMKCKGQAALEKVSADSKG